MGTKDWKAGVRVCREREQRPGSLLNGCVIASAQRELEGAPHKDRGGGLVSETPRQSPRAQGRWDQEVRTDRGWQSWLGQTRWCWRVRDVWGFLPPEGGGLVCSVSHSTDFYGINKQALNVSYF